VGHQKSTGVFIRFPNPNSKGYNNTAFVGVDFGFEVQIDQLAAPDRSLPGTPGDPRYIGLQTHTGRVAFRNIQFKAL
jgi:hypothetical protein